ncbi:unnamed protein product [Allacma fusca]|uniref:Uncharacterized protein n=1 Tax=Allacma fusca TaxID=39272 RepID=A0A8J2LDF2_9HEXA|nr:unnamed protein product [Allacma fusca]
MRKVKEGGGREEEARYMESIGRIKHEKAWKQTGVIQNYFQRGDCVDGGDHLCSVCLEVVAVGGEKIQTFSPKFVVSENGTFTFGLKISKWL